MKQYPDYIIVTWKTDSAKDEESGIYTPGLDQTFESDCRCEANMASRKVLGKDGQSMVDYAFDIFMPKTTVNIPAFEADYVLTGKSVGEIRGKVKRAKNNQFNSQIWL